MKQLKYKLAFIALVFITISCQEKKSKNKKIKEVEVDLKDNKMEEKNL